jgi:hypothetical protein
MYIFCRISYSLIKIIINIKLNGEKIFHCPKISWAYRPSSFILATTTLALSRLIFPAFAITSTRAWCTASAMETCFRNTKQKVQQLAKEKPQYVFQILLFSKKKKTVWAMKILFFQTEKPFVRKCQLTELRLFKPKQILDHRAKCKIVLGPRNCQ